MTGSTGTETHSRPSWDDVWAHVAEAVSARSLCVRAQVGAVIVDSRNRIVATGYNGPPAGFDSRDADGDSTLSLGCVQWCGRASSASYVGSTDHLKPDYSDCVSLHAEANALLAADRSAWQGGTIYVDSDICFACAKLIANSGLSTVIVNRVVVHEHRNPESSYKFLERCGLTVVIE